METPPAGYIRLYGDGPGKLTQTGFAANFGLGAQYNLGTISVFGDAGASLPLSHANDNRYFRNYTPVHFTTNVGIRFRFGSVK